MAIKIIDISTHQKEIDWDLVKAQSIGGAILRIGYTGWGSLDSAIDAYFEQNYQGVISAGLPVGVYFYSVAITEAEAIAEAKFALNILNSRHLDYPIYFDTEESNRKPVSQANVGKEQLTKTIKAFCDYILNNSNYKVGVYASKSWFNSKLNYADIADYSIWVAQYNETCTFTDKYDIWQYSSTEKLDGIDGVTDINYLYTDFGESEEETLKLKVVKQKLVIRDKLTFTTKSIIDYDPFTKKNVKRTRAAASGKVLATLNIGTEITVTDLISGIAADGWQWVKVDYNGIVGYCQYDSMAYTLEK